MIRIIKTEERDGDQNDLPLLLIETTEFDGRIHVTKAQRFFESREVE